MQNYVMELIARTGVPHATTNLQGKLWQVMIPLQQQNHEASYASDFCCAREEDLGAEEESQEKCFEQ